MNKGRTRVSLSSPQSILADSSSFRLNSLRAISPVRIDGIVERDPGNDGTFNSCARKIQDKGHFFGL